MLHFGVPQASIHIDSSPELGLQEEAEKKKRKDEAEAAEKAAKAGSEAAKTC